MARKKKRRSFPKTHRFKVGDKVVFKHAGSVRIGHVTELTREADRHATYTVTTSGNNRIYPCLGLDGSKACGYIINNDIKKYTKAN